MKGFFLFCALMVTISCARNSGLNIVLQQSTMNNIKNAVWTYFRNELLTYPIPDMVVAGYQLQNIQINQFNENPADFTLTTDSGLIKVDINNFAFTSSMVVERINSFSEPVQVTGSNCEVTFDMTPVLNSTTGLLSYTFSNVDVTLNDLAVQCADPTIQSTGNGLVGTSQFVDSLEQILEVSIQSGLTNNLNSLASGTPSSVPLPRFPFSISTMMTAAPALNSDYITAFLDGTVFTTSAGYSVPPITAPVALPEVDTSDSQGVQLFVSDYVWNSYLYNMWTNNYLDIVLTDQQLPFNSTLRLTTDSMDNVFPGLLSTYGSGKSCSLHCLNLGGSPPSVTSQNGVMSGNIQGFCDLYVIQQTWVRVLTFYGNAAFTGQIIVSNNQLAYQVDSVTFSNITIQEDQQIGVLDNPTVQANMNNDISSWLPAQAALPNILVPQGQMINPSVTSYDGYTKILFDLQLQQFTDNYSWNQMLATLGYY